MIRNYITVALRNVGKNKIFSFINIFGLTLGLTCSFLIGLWVQDEYAMDAFHDNLDRLYAVTSTGYTDNVITSGGYQTPALLGAELPNVFPEIEAACNYSWTEYRTFGAGDVKVKMPGNFAGRDFFKMFSYHLLSGSKETALESPESIALSRDMATTLFGSPEVAMGQSITFENDKELKVTAVFENPGHNSSQQFKYILNWHLFLERNPWAKDWHSSGPTTFIQLKDHADPAVFTSKLQHFLKNYDNEYAAQNRVELSMQPFGEMYLHSNFKNGKVAGGRIESVRVFSVVAISILLIACINFMNLSTARSIKRATEVGVRKVNGAGKKALIIQFLLEAFLFTLMAVLLAIGALFILLPEFNLLTGKNIQTPIGQNFLWVGIACITIITAVVSGSYPAFLLSSYKPMAVIRRDFKNRGSAPLLRKGLVVFQFGLCMIFIACMIVVAQQVSFIQNKDLGYTKRNLLYVALTGTLASNFNTFKFEALKIPGIVDISQMSQRPVELENGTEEVDWENKDPQAKPMFTQIAVGYDFVKTIDASLITGRDFSETFADSASYLVNQKALDIIGYKDPVGMPLTLWGRQGTIVGVVKDFHFNSLHVPIEPLIIRLTRRRASGYALVRTEPGKTSDVIAALETLHKKLNPDFVFAHQFADEEIAYLYKSEQVLDRLSRYFTSLAILISSLGLLGLAVFSAEQRRKEVGIRKVLGASVTQISLLLSRDFVKLVVLAIILSTPIAYFAVNDWLKRYEYKVAIEWWFFFAAAAGSLALALLTISFQTIKSARENPVKSLRLE